MRLVRAIVGLGVLLSAGLGAPASAEPLPSADLAVWATTTQGDSGVGKTVLAKLAAVDYGPNAVSYGKVTREVIAPSGTVIVNEFDSSCTWVVPKRRVRCTQSGGFLVHSGGNFVNIWNIYLKITSPYVKPGRQTISWGNDPKLSNNSAPIRVAGMPTASPKPPKATLSPSPKASPSTVTSASPSAVATESATPIESSSEAAPVVAEGASSSSSGMSTGGFIVGGIAVLLGLALLAGALWRGRNRTAQEEWDEAAIVDDSRFGQNGGS